MSPETIEARERHALALDAWTEAQSILSMMTRIDADHLDALRGMAMRCDDLTSVMAQAFDNDSMKVEEAWKIMCGREHSERRAEFLEHVKAEGKRPG